MRRIWSCCVPFCKSLVVPYAFHLHFLSVPNSCLNSIMVWMKICEDYWDWAPESLLSYSMALHHHNMVPIQVPHTWCLFSNNQSPWGEKVLQKTKMLALILSWADPGWMPGACQSSITPLLGWTGERKNNKRLMGQDKDSVRLVSFTTNQIKVG